MNAHRGSAVLSSATFKVQPSATGLSDNHRLRLFSGSANIQLSQEVARYVGMDLGPMIRKRFADGELYVQIQESIRGCDVYLIQPCCQPVNDHLMELLIMVDACRRASARQVTAVIPYYGYARADRKTAGRESITAKLVANLITEAGANRVLAMDLHSAQIQGYFDIPFDHVYGSPVLLDYLASKELPDLVVVSPDVGGVARARAFAKKLNDFDLASNNGGWQWAAGSGCDAAPYFRVFNPEIQQKKFDEKGIYIRKWIKEFELGYGKPMVEHAMARDRAIATYKAGILK